MELLGIDAGNHRVKVAGSRGVMGFLSCIGEYRDLKLKQAHGEDDMVWEYEGRRGFAGSLAKHESEFSGSIMGDTKAHADAKLRTLLAIHRYAREEDVAFIISQPIGSHTDTAKNQIKTMLQGSHRISVNGKERVLNIRRVEVSAEGAAAFWSAPKMGRIRILDLGSGTINCATLLDKRYIDRDSFTLRWGMETTKTKDDAAIARAIFAECSKKFEPDDETYIIGGRALELEAPMREFFLNARALRPLIDQGGKLEPLHPIYANAVGNYELARRLFQ